MKLHTVGIVGLGLMGAGIAKLAGSAGFTTHVYDTSSERVAQVVADLSAHGITAHPATSLKDLRDCDLILEAIVEAIEPKLSLFAELEHIAPNAILASNSSTFMPSELVPALSDPSRLINCHFFNPAEVVPLVEIVTSAHTNPAHIAAMEHFVTALGKTAVHLNKETPGFIANRLQAAILRECYALADDGVASPEDIDTVVRLSLAPRWAALGPLATADLGGLDIFDALTARLFPLLNSTIDTPELMHRLVLEGRHGAKTGSGLYQWSDEQREEALERVSAFFNLAQGVTHNATRHVTGEKVAS